MRHVTVFSTNILNVKKKKELHLWHHIQPYDKPKCVKFVVYMLEHNIAEHLRTILWWGHISCSWCCELSELQNFGSSNPYAVIEHVLESPILNVQCSIMLDRTSAEFTWISWRILCLHREQKSVASFSCRIVHFYKVCPKRIWLYFFPR
jgi:hypothetical protein